MPFRGSFCEFEILQMVADPIRQNLLPDPVKYPFYQPKYTVVLELKNVLVHPEWDVSFSLSGLLKYL